MARASFTPGTRYLLNAHVYHIQTCLDRQRLLVENQTAGGQVIVTVAELTAAWVAGTLCFEVAGLHTLCPQPMLATAYTFADFQELPERYRTEAWRRYQCLLPLLQLAPQDRTAQAIRDHAATLSPACPPDPTPRRVRGPMGSAISAASLTRWLHAFVASGADIRSLVPAAYRQGGKGQRRLQEALDTIIDAVLTTCAARPQYRTVQDVYLMIVHQVAEQNQGRPPDDQLPLPGRTTVYRRIQAVGADTILRRRASRAEARAAAPTFPGPTLTRILERVELDHTTLDLFLVDSSDRLPIGRPTLTTALDVYSGFPLGCYVGFEPPSYRAVMNCLLHAILPKEDTRHCYQTRHPWDAYGLPETLVVDNAPEFAGRDLADACGQLGIALTHSPIQAPWFRGSIERHFRTNNTSLIHTLPGTTFSNLMQRGDDDPSQHACISLAAFWEILHIFLLDIYAQRWHKGIQGIPAQRWAESLQRGTVPTLHYRADEVRMLLLRTETRTLQRYGIEFETLIYQNTDLAQLRTRLPADDRTVRFKYDPGDLQAIYVRDIRTPGRWLRVPAVDHAYAAGLSLWKHRLIRRYVLQQQRQVDMVALAEAKHRIQTIVEREFHLMRTSRERKTAARFLELGTGPLPSTAGSDAAALQTIPPRDPPSGDRLLADASPTTEIGSANQPSIAGSDNFAFSDILPPLDTTGFSGDLHLPVPGLQPGVGRDTR